MDVHGYPESSERSPTLPRVSVSLSTSSDILDMYGWPRFALKTTVMSLEDRPITVLTRNTILEPGQALFQKRLEFFDAQSSAKIDRATMAICTPRPVRRTCSSEKLFITLQPGVSHPVTHIMSTPTSSLQPIDTDINGLERGRTYILKAVENYPLTWWSYGTKHELLNLPGKSTTLSQATPLPLNDVGTCKFLVGEVIPKPPRVSISLSPSSSVNTKVSFDVTITLLDSRPVTLVVTGTLLDSEVAGGDLIRITDVGTGELLQAKTKECLQGKPQPERLVTLEPEVPFIATIVLKRNSSLHDFPDRRLDSQTSDDHRTVWPFKSSHVYEGAITDGQEIQHWRYGAKEDMFDRSDTSATEHWWECTTIPLDLCEPVRFMVDPPEPDQLDVRLSMSASSRILELSGSPPFELSITAISHEPYPITLKIVKTILQPSLSLMQDKFSFVDVEHATEVKREHLTHRVIGMEGAWAPKDRFITLEPGVSRTVKTAFTTQADRFDHTNGLESGKNYRLRVKDDEPVKWWKGIVDDIASVAGPEARVGPSGRLRLACSDEVIFDVH